jgi:hypothetical protein
MLNNARINSLKAKEKMYRVADGGGLTLEIKPSGAKIWRYRCRMNHLATMLTLGHYPAVTLAEARRARDDLKQKIREGIDPRVMVEEETGVDFKTFRHVFEEWFEHNVENWTEGCAKYVNERCNNHLLVYIGSKPISTLMP